MKKTTYHTTRFFKRTFNNGFTLIEMLVVIAIIAILSGIIIANLSGAKAKARDAKRISDLGNIQMALELYFDRCNSYPYDVNGYTGLSGVPAISTSFPCPKTNTNTNARYQITDFINPIPVPTGEAGQNVYYYYNHHPTTDGVVTASDDYILEAILESPNPAAVDGLNNAQINPNLNQTALRVTYPCSNDSGSKNYCIGPK